jgi:hypothetical protein
MNYKEILAKKRKQMIKAKKAGNIGLAANISYQMFKIMADEIRAKKALKP